MKKMTLTTSKVLSRIRSASSPEDAVALHSSANEPLFSEVLYSLMEKHSLKAKEMIRRCRIERSYFYHILSGKKIPSRNMTIRIGLCAEADLKEMDRLLRLSNSPGLYPKIRRDALIIYAISNKMTMEQTNLLLIQSEETPLYREEKNA